MYVKSLSALTLGVAAAALAYVGFGDSIAKPSNALGLPKVERGLDVTYGWLDALRRKIEATSVGEPETLSGTVATTLTADDVGAAPLPAPIPAECVSSDRVAAGTAVIGDQISMRFFESERGDTGSRTSVYYERLDLSGSYQVDVRGEVSIPLIGRVLADGQTLACLEARVAAGYITAFASQASVAAAFAARSPAIVTGVVRAPGSYVVGPGMTLRHLLALAGTKSGPGGSATDPGVASVLARKRELEYLRSGVRLELQGLEAARARSATLTLSPRERTSFLRDLGPERLESEASHLSVVVLALQRQQDELTADITDKLNAVEFLSQEQERLKSQLFERQERLATLRSLTERGIAPVTRLTADEAALVVLERAAFEVDRELLLQRAELAKTERQMTETVDDYLQSIVTEVREQARELDAIDAQLAAIDLQLSLVQDGESGPAVRYSILRMERGGQLRLDATLATPILPGDLVEVEASARVAAEAL